MQGRYGGLRAADRSPEPAATAGEPAGGGAGVRRLAIAVGAVAWLLRARTAGHVRTWDETNWLLRSARFAGAVTTGAFDHASSTPDWGVATMPGVTTMGIGSVAYEVWRAGRALGLWAGDGGGFADSPSGLLLAHLGVATVTAALVALLVVLVARWTGLVAAGIAGTLVATEPFLVAHGALIHTDELMSLSGVGSLVATAIAVGVPVGSGRPDRRYGVLAGLLFAGALLTKISALIFLPAAALIVAWAVVRARGSGALRDPRCEVRRAVAGWVAGAAGLTLAGYPALWLMLPGAEIGRLTMSAGLGVYPTQVVQLFLGRPVNTPGPTFYVVDLPFRMTPWFLVAGTLAAVVIWCRSESWAYGAALACFGGPPLAVLSFTAKQSDRYGLPLLVIAAIGIGIVAARALTALVNRYAGSRRPVLAVAAAAVVAVTGYSLSVAPWGLAYVNPLLGGGSAAVRQVPLGWGEGLERAGAFIAAREARRCDAVSVYSTWHLPEDFPCGRWLTLAQAGRATYVVVYIADRQVLPPARVAELVGPRQLLSTVTIRGLTYAQVYGPAGPGGG